MSIQVYDITWEVTRTVDESASFEFWENLTEPPTGPVSLAGWSAQFVVEALDTHEQVFSATLGAGIVANQLTDEQGNLTYSDFTVTMTADQVSALNDDAYHYFLRVVDNNGDADVPVSGDLIVKAP